MVETYSYVMCAFGSADFVKEGKRISAPENLESFLDELMDILLLFVECQLGKLDFLYTLWSSG